MSKILGWETYDGQETVGFTHIGAVGHDMIPIDDPQEQYEEFCRKYGKRVEVRLYTLADCV